MSSISADQEIRAINVIVGIRQMANKYKLEGNENQVNKMVGAEFYSISLRVLQYQGAKE
jgi:hypothetical protein